MGKWKGKTKYIKHSHCNCVSSCVSSEGAMARKHPPPSHILSEGGGGASGGSVVGKHPPSVCEEGKVSVVATSA